MLVYGIYHLSPLASSLYINLGRIELGKGTSQGSYHLARASLYFQRSLDLAPTDLRGYHSLAQVAVANGEYLEAAATLSQILTIDPANVMAHFWLGTLYSALGRRSEALDHWQQTNGAKAIAFNLYRSGLKALHQGDEAQAEASFLDAVALDPTLIDGYLALGNFYAETDIDKAIWAFEKIATNDSASSAQRYYAQGRIHLLKGEWLLAIGALQDVVTIDPNYATAYYLLGFAFYKLGEFSSAEGPLQKAVELTPDYFWAHLLLGQVYLERGDVAQALSFFHRARALRPENAVAYVWPARAYREQGRLDEAATELEKATQLDPDNPKWHLELADVYRDNHQPEIALREYEKVLTLDPDNSRARSEIEKLRGGDL
jgi:superkiller protein 3